MNIHPKILYQRAPHSGFTDLCAYKDELYCCFRIATNHVSPNGKIIILRMDKSGQIIQKIQLQQPYTDLRDPKLSVDHHGRLLLLTYARELDHQGRFKVDHNLVWFSSDGHSFSAPHTTGPDNWWLWRISWYQQQALGLAYNRQANALDLYAGDPLRRFECIQPGVLSLARHGKGYPNESAIVFDQQGVAYALVRRDADTGSAMLGVAKPPYRQWHWRDLGFYLGGPAMVWCSPQLLLGGRIWTASGPKMALIMLNPDDLCFRLCRLLPSGGDCSYPGLQWQDDNLLVSYYSSHQSQHSRIYFTSIPRHLLEVIE